jgi:hypothetical protein
MGLQLVSGNVPQHLLPGGQQYMLINEKLAFTLGWKPAEAVGKRIRKDEQTNCLVVGVVKDFTQNSLQEPIHPLAMCLIAPAMDASSCSLRSSVVRWAMGWPAC